MTNKRGFTLIELMVVVAILGALTIVAAFNYAGVQRQTRDMQRTSSATLIAESLERYFAKNGEYPSVAKMTAADGNSVKSLLDLANTDSLLAPFAAPGATNSWKSGTATNTNSLTYNGNTDTSASCSTATGSTDACDDFKIQYYDEQSNSVMTIYSRNTSQNIDTTTVTGIAAPSSPTLSAALSGTNVVATATTVSCEQGTSPQYAFRSRTNSGSWTAYGAWGTATSTSTAAAQGVLYGFQIKARCLSSSSSNSSADSSNSTEATYTHPINTPAAPNVTVATSGDISTWSWNATTCPAGTTARYQYRYVADWGYTSIWYGPTTGLVSLTWDTSSQGYQYTTQIQTHCYNAYDTSDWSGTGQASYIRPVSPPGPISHSISRGAPNIVYVYATSSCHSSVALYSRADVHTWDYPWEDNGAFGWYANTHGGIWVVNNWGYYGSTVRTGSINHLTNLNSGSRWNIATDMMCSNMTTGRASASTGRVQSGTMTLP
jgi:prepilin-type N-terminal cleavage/methylation domain-containing protein